MQDRLLSAKKKRDKGQEASVAFEVRGMLLALLVRCVDFLLPISLCLNESTTAWTGKNLGYHLEEENCNPREHLSRDCTQCLIFLGLASATCALDLDSLTQRAEVDTQYGVVSTRHDHDPAHIPASV